MSTRPNLAAALVVVGVLIIGCSASDPAPSGSTRPVATATGSLAPAATSAVAGKPSPGAGASQAAGGAATAQTDTAWGRIWDALPSDFPRYPGSTPSEAAATGPASAILAVSHEAAAVATWMRGQLTKAGFAVDGSSDPLEDGRYDLDASRDGGCHVRVTVTPTGSLTTVTILYGAGCPDPKTGA